MTTKKTDEIPFEKALERLEKIVERLEGGNVPLEESLALFEEGVGLAGQCSKRLDDTKKKIEMLVKKPGGMAVEPMPEDAGDTPF